MNLLEVEGCGLGRSTYVGKNRVNMYSYSKQTISVIFTKKISVTVQKMEQFDFMIQLCIKRMHIEWQTV